MSLVLMRREGQRITIGKDIEILVKEIRSKMVYLSIDAPKNFEISRIEITSEKNQKNTHNK